MKVNSFNGFHDTELLSKVKSYIDAASADEVVLSAGFFRGFSCVENCAGCCKNVRLDIDKDSERWTRFETLFTEKSHLFTELEDESGMRVMSFVNKSEDDYCNFLDKENGRCTVHAAAPLPCRIAPVKFIDKRVSSNKVFLNASAYGRAWAFTRLNGTKGAACEVLPFDYNKFLNDLAMLKELRQYAIKLNIPTKLKYIIEFLEEWKLYYDEFKEVPTESFIFKETNVL